MYGLDPAAAAAGIVSGWHLHQKKRRILLDASGLARLVEVVLVLRGRRGTVLVELGSRAQLNELGPCRMYYAGCSAPSRRRG
jgi:hypothetical protein